MADIDSSSVKHATQSNEMNTALLSQEPVNPIIDVNHRQIALAINSTMSFRQALHKTWSAGWPLSLSGLCAAANGTISQIIIVATGKQDYLPAIGLVYQGQLLTGSTASAVLFGVAIFSGKLIGQAKSDSTNAVDLHSQVGGVVQSGLMLATAMSVPVILFNVFSEDIFKLSGQNSDVSAIAGRYFIGASWGIPAYLSFGLLQQFILATGYPKTVLMTSIANTLLLGGIGALLVNVAKLDMEGMGHAFSIANWASFLLLAIYCAANPQLKGYKLFNTHKFKEYMNKIKELWSVGYPIGLQIASDLSLFAIIGIQAGRNSVKTLATNAVPDTFLGIAALSVIRFAQANAALISRKVGAKNIHDAKLLGRSGLVYGAIAAVVIAALFIGGHQWLTDIVVQDKSTIDQNLVVKLFMWNAIAELGDVASNMITGEARGYYYTKVPSLINIFGRVLITIAFGYVFANYFEDDIESFYIGRAIGLAALVVFAATTWKKQQVEKEFSLYNQN